MLAPFALLATAAAQASPAPPPVPTVIDLPARTATVHGKTLRYEPQPHKNCLGYWTEVGDWAEWSFTLPSAGRYAVEVWQGCGQGHGGSDVKVAVGATRWTMRVEDTGHFQNFVPRLLGLAALPAGDHKLSLVPERKASVAVMDIRRVRLLAIDPLPPLGDAARRWTKRVVVLGDSITYDSGWLACVETCLRLQAPQQDFDLLNLALPSETLSGLSEPGHAGGKFPRPDLHERLARVLERLQPAIVVACYGMNDGIYAPFAEERFAAFREGTLRLRAAAGAAGARVVHITPPPFDPTERKGDDAGDAPAYDTPADDPPTYDAVLARYAAWLVEQRQAGWDVIDVHTALASELRARRADDRRFRLAPDGVHLDAHGHWLFAKEVLASLDVRPAALHHTFAATTLGMPSASAVFDVVRRRQHLLRDAWLTEIGHRRPGLAAGQPIAKAEQAAQALLESLPR